MASCHLVMMSSGQSRSPCAWWPGLLLWWPLQNTRNFGVVSIIGVYGGFLDKIPMGSAINRG